MLVQLSEECINKGKKKGNTTTARYLEIGCDRKTCKRRCQDKINPQLRLTILKMHWELGQRRIHWDYIAKAVKVNEPKFWRTPKENKDTSRVYTFTVDDEGVLMLKKFYLHTLSIAATVVTTALNLLKMADGGFVEPGQRGAHSTRPQ